MRRFVSSENSARIAGRPYRQVNGEEYAVVTALVLFGAIGKRPFVYPIARPQTNWTEVAMGVIAVACYKPRAGKEAQLSEAVRDHMTVLRGERLIEDRPAIVMKAKDGTIVEIFEWKSDEAIEQAHKNRQVGKLWERFNAACEYVPLASVPECEAMFANFEPVNL
jgi:hypothetical protein